NDLGTLGGPLSWAYAINTSGQVAGLSNTGSFPSTAAFLYSNGIMSNLGSLGGYASYAYAINAPGDVVGASYIAGDTFRHGFIYRNGAMVDLGIPGADSFANG